MDGCNQCPTPLTCETDFPVIVSLLEGLTHPDSWNDPDPYDPYRRVQLSTDCAEYKEVLSNVRKTCSSSVKQIIKVRASGFVLKLQFSVLAECREDLRKDREVCSSSPL